MPAWRLPPKRSGTSDRCRSEDGENDEGTQSAYRQLSRDPWLPAQGCERSRSLPTRLLSLQNKRSFMLQHLMVRRVSLAQGPPWRESARARRECSRHRSNSRITNVRDVGAETAQSPGVRRESSYATLRRRISLRS